MILPVPSVMNQQPQCVPCNDIVQLAAYRDLLILDGGQSFDGDPLQYHLFFERLNSGVLRIFGNSDPGVALQIVTKSCSGDALSAIRGCAAIPDKAVALKQALDILARLFGSQRSAIDGHIKRVCEGRVVDDVKDLRSLLIDMMTCQQVLVNNGYGVQLDSIDTTQKVCRRLPFKLREKVREIASNRSLGRVLYQDLIDIVNKRLDQLDTCYAESNKGTVSKRAGGNVHVSSQNKTRCARANVYKSDATICVVCNEASHAVHLCPELVKLSVGDRRSKVQSSGLCYNCLGQGHRVFNCKSPRRCGECKGKHHSLLHIVKKSLNEVAEGKHNSSSSAMSGTIVKTVAAGSCASIRLKVLPVKLRNSDTGLCLNT